MFLLDDVLVYSSRDLAEAAQCEFLLLSTVDSVLGRGPRPAGVDDPMLDRTARLGNATSSASWTGIATSSATVSCTSPAPTTLTTATKQLRVPRSTPPARVPT